MLHYRNRLSGPVLDRIDLYSNVHEIDHNKLLAQKPDPESDLTTCQRIVKAREIQALRYRKVSKLNADMTNSDIKMLAVMEPSAIASLNKSSRQINLSVRAYMRTVKVARTIADLEQSEPVTEAHLNEALYYRYKIPKER